METGIDAKMEKVTINGEEILVSSPCPCMEGKLAAIMSIIHGPSRKMSRRCLVRSLMAHGISRSKANECARKCRKSGQPYSRFYDLSKVVNGW